MFKPNRTAHRTEVRSRDQLIPSLAALVETFGDCFHPRVFSTFRALIAGWIVCIGPHTIRAIWQATGRAAKRPHDTAHAVFHSACWEWDDLGLVLATLILTPLVPGGEVRVAGDDPLGPKRGAKVAFGGICLDAVMSSEGHKTFRFGLNWVVLGVAVPIPFRADRYYCLPVLWRLDRETGQEGYQARPQSAAARARELAEANPERTFWPVGDRAYVNAAVLRGRPANLQVIGPPHGEAAPFQRPAPRLPKQRDAWRKKGDRLPNPKAMVEDTESYPAELLPIAFPNQTRELRVQVIRDVLWDKASKSDPVMVVLVRDPLGQWRDEALVSTDPTATAPFVILGYCRRWRVELAFFDSKQLLGLHDPRVRSERSVERAHPMAWFVGSLTIPWYRVTGHEGSHVERERPWYEAKVTPTFTDRLGALRLQMWESKIYGESGEEPPTPESIKRLLHTLSAVA